mmetsp:Transcript_18701/g.50268  ORF Transcript_18701/g.50268 Transcript_18701/m.50268 type:complete len:214 (-) Transcript_18701:107-748(-)
MEQFDNASLEMEQQVARVQAVARGRKTRTEMHENLSAEQSQKLTAAKNVGADATRSLFREVHEVLGVSKDAYNSSPALRKAHAYLNDHQLQQLLESLLARAVLERPPDLRGFLRDRIREMQESRGVPSMGPFVDEDLDTMFNMWDALETGTIPVSKVAETLRSLNCSPGREAEAVQEAAGEGCEQVDRKLFTKIVRAELEKVFSAPAAKRGAA